MDAIQELELREREIREALAALGAEEDPDSAKVSALTGEIRQVNTKLLALRASNPEPETRRLDPTKPEGREMQELESRASIGDVFSSVLSGHQITGAMAELQQARGLRSNEVSIYQLQGEQRVATQAPTNVGANQQPIIPYVFPGSSAAYLSVDIPVVGAGEAVFPVLTSELMVHTPIEGGAAAETDGTFSSEALKPARIQASFFYSREDRATFAGMDASLRENLSNGLASGLDKQIIQGANGLVGTNGLTVRSGDAGSTANFSTYRGLLYDASTLDGRYAAQAGDVRILMGSATYVHAAGIYRTGNNTERSALEAMMADAGGVRISAHIPDPSSNDQDVIVRKGSARDAVAPVWENIAIIEDEVTKAGVGQIVITAVMLHNVQILRSDGFQRRAIQSA